MSNYLETSHLVTKLEGEWDFDVTLGKLANEMAVEVVFPSNVMSDKDKGAPQVYSIMDALCAELKRQGMNAINERMAGRFVLSLDDDERPEGRDALFEATKKFFLAFQKKVKDLGLENAVYTLPGGKMEPDVSRHVRPGARRYASACVAARREMMAILMPREPLEKEGIAIGGMDKLAAGTATAAGMHEQIADKIVECAKKGPISLSDAREEIEAIFTKSAQARRLDGVTKKHMITALSEACAKHAALIALSVRSQGRER